MSKKVIIITGASSGIGKVTAIKLLNEGHIIYGAARRVQQMDDLKKLGAKIVKMDIAKEEDIQKCVNQVIEEQGRIDVLFNNAGFGLHGAVEDISIEDAKYQFEVNLFGLARITQLVLPHMRQQKSGKIINTSSVAGRIYSPLGAWYHASKHALEGWSDSLRLEVKKFGIDVVIIEPGLIQTSFGDIVSGPLKKNSGKGAYKEMAEIQVKAIENYYKQSAGSSPTVIADVVSKAINARKPKLRYLKGRMAKPLVRLRKWLGDNTFDKIILSRVK